MKKDNGLLFIGLGIIILSLPFLLSLPGIIGDGISGLKQKKVTCEITVGNPVGIPVIRNGDLRIESVSCEAVDETFCSPLSFFGIITDRSGLIFSAGGKATSQTVSILESQKKKFSLDLCVDISVNSGIIKLIEENQILGTKEVSF